MDSSNPTGRRSCFIEEDDGLASLPDMEAGISGHHHQFRRRSFRCLSAGASSRFEDPQPHFLDACFLCRKPLADNSDIFMYRGDTPFCSEECRQEQIEMDEAKEKKWNRSSSMKAALRKKDQRKSSSRSDSSPPPDYQFRAGTVAAA